MATNDDPFEDVPSLAVDRLDENIEEIVRLNRKIADFWSVAHGWAPQSAAELLSSAALDWQVDLSKSLRIWAELSLAEPNCGDAPLILAWANLGSLTEGTLIWFLSVYDRDFRNEQSKRTGKRKLRAQDKLRFEDLQTFFEEEVWQEFPSYQRAVETIRLRRNAIHSFSRRELGDWEAWCESVADYLDILFFLDELVPYPEEGY